MNPRPRKDTMSESPTRATDEQRVRQPQRRRPHSAYDSHRLDLIGYLRPDEQIEAVRVLGLARAYRRLGGFVDA